MADYSYNFSTLLTSHLGLPSDNEAKDGGRQSEEGPITYLNSYFESSQFKNRFLLRNSEESYVDQMNEFKKYKSEYKPYVFKDLNHYGANRTKREGFSENDIPGGTNIVLGAADSDLSDGAGGMNSILNSALPHEYSHLMRNLSFKDELQTGSLSKNKWEFLKRVNRYLDPLNFKKDSSGKPENTLSQFIRKDVGFYGLNKRTSSDEDLDKAYDKNHDAAPNEQYSDLNALRWLMYKEGIYDTRKGNMKAEDLKKALDNKNINGYLEVKRLKEHFSPEDILILNNTVASLDPVTSKIG